MFWSTEYQQFRRNTQKVGNLIVLLNRKKPIMTFKNCRYYIYVEWYLFLDILSDFTKKPPVCSTWISCHLQILDDDGLAAPGEIIRPDDVYINKQSPIDAKKKGDKQTSLTDRLIIAIFQTICIIFFSKSMRANCSICDSVNIGQPNRDIMVLKGRPLLWIRFRSALTGILTYASNSWSATLVDLR